MIEITFLHASNRAISCTLQ